ncbi:MAG: methyltransferase domain-containing protein [Nocardioidaceae bacterium]
MDDEAFRALVFVLDLQAGSPAIRRIRAWTMDRLAPQPGEIAIDIGSGTGEDVQLFADLVGETGRAVGVEPSSRMRALAESRAGEAGSRATFMDADAHELPFADSSVDVVRSERVFQHLDDPERAAAEIARILRPGGRVAIIDSDWGSAIMHPGDPDVVRRLQVFMWGDWANPFSGRRLPRLLTAAGLSVDPDIGSQATILPQQVAGAAPMIEQSTAGAVAEGAISADERASDSARRPRPGRPGGLGVRVGDTLLGGGRPTRNGLSGWCVEPDCAASPGVAGGVLSRTARLRRRSPSIIVGDGP